MPKNTNICQIVEVPKAKRVFDILVSTIFIIITSPIFILLILALSVEHLFQGSLPRPIYIDKRISLGQPFNFLKFNIFKPRVIKNLKNNGDFIDTKKLEWQGGNLTFIGFIIQKSYLDELPQLFNVLVGDMSAVGPRPVNLRVYKRNLDNSDYTKAIIKTGLAGPYQSHKGEAGVNQRQKEEEYINYVQNHRASQIIINDIKLMIGTLIIVFKAKGY
ncbi:sugar transferase [Candidatus Parcubacteria bacterium]|nr:sugar transferase [Candidatus Parcubacteria bacterium]